MTGASLYDPDMFVGAFARNTWVIRRQLEGLDHADTLLQTPYNINCLNWVLGHILDSRGALLETLGAQPPMSRARTERYRRESDPITQDGPDVIPLSELLEGIDESQARLDEAISRLGGDGLAAQTEDGGRTTTRAAAVLFGFFHDTYHVGQTELLRQVAGTDDKVI